MDIPSLFMIPSAVSSGKVHSVFPNSTDADFDFNRDSDATRVNSEGLIERVGYYGSEKIVNGDFSSASGWSTSNASISNGVATLTGVPSQESNITRSDANGANGKTYKLTYTVISNNLIGTGSLFAGLITVNEIIFKANIPMTVGTHTVVGNSAGTGANFSLHISSGFTGGELVLDNISVKEITGDRARLNYEIEGGLVNTKPSLLLEPQSTNLIPYSEDFSNSAWTKNNVTVTSGFTSPDGTNSAYLMTDDATDSKHGIYDVDILSQDGNVYTRSVFVKKGTARYVVLSARHIPTSSGTSWIYDFDVNNWVLTGSSGAGQSIKNYANGWVKLSVSHISNSNFNNDFSIGISSGATVSDASYSGSGDTLHIWGAQIEQLSYCTSYIPTNGSTQTRAAETCNGAGTSSIFESSEGILYADIEFLTLTGGDYFGLNDGTNNQRVLIHRSTNNIKVYINSAVELTSSISSLTHKVAVSYKANKYKLYLNGVQVATNTSSSVTPSGLNALDFEIGGGFGLYFYGKIRDIRVYNTKEMTDSEVDILLTKITS